MECVMERCEGLEWQYMHTAGPRRAHRDTSPFDVPRCAHHIEWCQDARPDFSRTRAHLVDVLCYTLQKSKSTRHDTSKGDGEKLHTQCVFVFSPFMSGDKS